jgi:hypothetical protein
VIYNLNDCCSDRLSNSLVELITTHQDDALLYTIVDATEIDMFSLLISQFNY